MAVKMLWQGLRERAESLRQAADVLAKKAEARRVTLPELALAAEEGRVGGGRAFDDAMAEVDRLVGQARQAEFAAAALDERAEQTRKEDIEFERNARVREMSDERAGYDYAVREMDRALADVEDAFQVLRTATSDYAGALRRAEFADASTALQRRASRMLQATLWANAPTLARALGVEGRFRHRAQSMADAAGFLPEKNEDEDQ